jgi:hypothetical protein
MHTSLAAVQSDCQAQHRRTDDVAQKSTISLCGLLFVLPKGLEPEEADGGFPDKSICTTMEALQIVLGFFEQRRLICLASFMFLRVLKCAYGECVWPFCRLSYQIVFFELSYGHQLSLV